MAKEFRIPHSAIQDPQTITEVNKRVFREHDLDFERHPAIHEDDHGRGERIVRVKTGKMFGPWKHRG